MGWGLLLPLVGCASTDPASAELDAIAHWFWTDPEGRADAELAAAAEVLHGALDADALGTPLTGTLTDLTEDELPWSILADPQDPARARGMFVADVLPCTLAQAEALTLDPDQAALYPETWNTFTRTWLTDLAAFQTHAAATVVWEDDLTRSLLGATFEARFEGRLRQAEAVEGAPFGPLLVERHVLVEPAVVLDPDASWPQDYEVEVRYERAPGELVHALFLWREIHFGAHIGTADDVVVARVLDTLLHRDERTAALCEGERP
jgi:hypothetical protein